MLLLNMSVIVLLSKFDGIDREGNFMNKKLKSTVIVLIGFAFVLLKQSLNFCEIWSFLIFALLFLWSFKIWLKVPKSK